GYGGDLIVTVTEADGRKHTFTVPYSALPQLLREGTTKYSVAAGQLYQKGTLDDSNTPLVMQATLQHGINNTITAYGGVIASPGYVQAKIGTAVSLPIGAVSLDIAASRTQIPNNNTGDASTLNGHSLGIAYNKNIPKTGTNFALG
ncbi:MAG: fimbria/pilus outer membrane usher protein, partial [Glaciimonas sp.]|nr:fimbria/pilus outer membrane usher protein [Glaciimonas sp.]